MTFPRKMRTETETPDINKILALPAHRASTARGADMGRRNVIPGKEHWPGGPCEPGCVDPGRLHLQRLRFVDGDYDTGGAYWGGGTPAKLYCAFFEYVPLQVYVRATNRTEARAAVLNALPGSGWSFYR